MTNQASRADIRAAFDAAVAARLAHWACLTRLEKLLYPEGDSNTKAFEKVAEYVEDRAVTQADIPLSGADVEIVLAYVAQP